MKASERNNFVQKKLKKLYPIAECALRHENPLQLLVSTILSAQCTDERVNLVTPALFAKFRSAEAYAKADRTEIEALIRSTGFFRSKARAIQEACADIALHHGGNVPQSMNELIQLHGVGRKTANVVLGEAFGKAEGIVVDTHVRRLSKRLGFTKQTDPVKIERDLMEIVPRSDWTKFSHRLIWHGRRVCKAIRPRCGECALNDLCPSSEV